MLKNIIYIVISFVLFLPLVGQEVRRTEYNEALLDKEIQQKIQQLKLKKTTKADTLKLPFFDDFSNYYGNVFPNQKYWADNKAFINTSFADSVISIGVATLDGIDELGNVYATSDDVIESDHLTSQYIDLYGTKNQKIFISFFVQGGGKADWPEKSDSLILHFNRGDSDDWVTVWKTEGYKSSTFKQVILEVDSVFKTNAFRFRFVNYTSMSPKSVIGKEGALSNVDCWHIDYVQVKSAADSLEMTILNDVAFTKPLESSIPGYESIPWDHYGKHSNFSPSSLNPVYFNTYFPNLGINLSIERTHQVYDYNSNEIIGIPPTLVSEEPPFAYISHLGDELYKNHSNSGYSGEFLYRSIINVTNQAQNKTNDTIIRIEKFNDYYAYDDGTAELGYGISGEGAYQAITAYKFRPFMDETSSDTLTGLQIYFNKTRNNYTAGKEFRVGVWDYTTENKKTVPGDLIFISDEFETYTPNYNKARYNVFDTITFDSLVIIHDTTFFIGIIQETNEFLNIGYDVNTDNRDKIYVKTSNVWTNIDSSIVPGTLMIRPVFGRYRPAEVEKWKNAALEIKISPNPARTAFKFNFDNEINTFDTWNYEIYDATGKLLMRNNWDYNQVDISGLPKGIYFIRLINLTKNNSYHQKLIKIE